MRSTAHALVLALSLLNVVGCEPKPCDEGDTYAGGVCFKEVKLPDAGKGPADAQAPASSADAGDAAPMARSYEGFGAPCADAVNHSDCKGDANFCAKATPDQAMGNCTVINCLKDLDMCPPDYSCCNIQAVLPSNPFESVCIATKAVPVGLAENCMR